MNNMTLALASVRDTHHSRREESGERHEQVSVRESLDGIRDRGHVPVMLEETLLALAIKKGDVVVDATYGQGGHSKAIARAGARLITIDADPASGADIVGNFGDIAELLGKRDVTQVDKVLLDLGWNMGQLASGRGFSFLHDEPLNMSFAPTPRSGFTAAQILNTWDEHVLADVLFGYGEERYAKHIAKRIVERRNVKPFSTTFELVELVKDSVSPTYRHGRLHPATKTFQALRIAANDELRVLESGLRGAWSMLKPQGRIAVITFHSIEDRVVKKLFQTFTKEGGVLVYKKPLVASKAETARNPASRSAKLRAIQKS